MGASRRGKARLIRFVFASSRVRKSVGCGRWIPSSVAGLSCLPLLTRIEGERMLGASVDPKDTRAGLDSGDGPRAVASPVTGNASELPQRTPGVEVVPWSQLPSEPWAVAARVAS